MCNHSAPSHKPPQKNKINQQGDQTNTDGIRSARHSPQSALPPPQEIQVVLASVVWPPPQGDPALWEAPAHDKAVRAGATVNTQANLTDHLTEHSSHALPTLRSLLFQQSEIQTLH